MAHTVYDENGIRNILLGAAFLGAGGGGAYALGVSMLEMLKKDGHLLRLETMPVEEADKEKLAATVAGLGAPSNVVMKKFERDLPGAFAALQEAYRTEGKTLTYLYSGEMGGLNTMVPIMLHIVSHKDPAKRTPMLDADANGRAVPELNTCLVTARGVPPSPVGIQGHHADREELSCRYLAWTQKTPGESADDIARTAESVARSMAIEYGQVGFATWAVESHALFNKACPGYVGIAKEVGDILNLGTPFSQEKCQALSKCLGGNARQLCVGEVKKFTRDMSAGFDLGRSTLLGEDKASYEIDFQNENIVAYCGGKPVITAPERISIVDFETCQPLTNVDEDIYPGRKVAVVVSAAHGNWWEPDMNAYRCWNPILDRVAYSGKYMDYRGEGHERQ